MMNKIIGSSVLALLLALAGAAYAGDMKQSDGMMMEHGKSGEMKRSGDMHGTEMSDHSMQGDMKPMKKQKQKDDMMMQESDDMHGGGMDRH